MNALENIPQSSTRLGWRAPFVLLWLVACLPFISYQMWRAISDLKRKDWISLATRTRQLHRVRFTTRTTRYWLATSYTKLGLWEDAVAEFEALSRPLDVPADNAARYCAHVWALSKLGRVDEARELLIHAIQADWPTDRQAWAGDFLDNASPQHDTGTFVARSSTLLH